MPHEEHTCFFAEALLRMSGDDPDHQQGNNQKGGEGNVPIHSAEGNVILDFVVKPKSSRQFLLRAEILFRLCLCGFHFRPGLTYIG